MRTGVHLYAARDAGSSLEERLGIVADAGFEGVEFLEGVPALVDADAGPVADALDGRGLDAISVRGGLSTFDRLDAVLDAYEPLGVEHVVVSSFDGALESIAGARAAAADLSALASEVRDRGLGLGVHNHGGQFDAADGETSPFEALIDATSDVHLELDVGWLAHDGRDPAALVERHADRIELLHVADYHPDRGLGVDLGEGVVDLDAVGRAARAAGVDWLVYDCDDPPSIPDSLVHAAGVVDGLAGR